MILKPHKCNYYIYILLYIYICFKISHELRRGELGLWRGQKMKEENLKGQTILRDNYLPGEGLYPAPIGKSCKKSSVQYQANKFKVS